MQISERTKQVSWVGQSASQCLSLFSKWFKSVKSYQGYAFGKVANKEKQEKQYKLECLKVYNCASGGQWIAEGQVIYIYVVAVVAKDQNSLDWQLWVGHFCSERLQ